jgi:hypothetical protein
MADISGEGRSLNDLQYEVNRRRSVMMEQDYKKWVESHPKPDFRNTMVFKRYPNLISDLEIKYIKLNVLVRAFLGFQPNCDVTASLLNEGWVVNLRTTEKEML